MSDQQLATKQRKDIREFLQSDAVKSQVALALPSYITPERMLRICVTSINRNPKLAECTTESLLSSIMQASQMGIEADGRHGHLIPRWSGKKQCTECTFQPDYKGLVALIRRSPDVEDIYADVVCEHDVFQIKKGLHRDLVHEIDIRAERGAIIGAYAVIQYRGGVASFEFMSRREIETGHRDRSESWKSHVAKGYDTPWKSDEGEMFKKTAIIRVSKLADLSPDVYERLSVDTEIPINDRVTEIPRAQIAGGVTARLEDAAPTPVEAPVSGAGDAGDTPAATGAEKPVEAKVIEPEKGTPRKKGKGLPAAKKKEEAAPTATEPAPDDETRKGFFHDRLTAMLKDKGYKPEQIYAVAADNGWFHEDEKQFSEMSEDLVKSFMDDFETAEQLLEAMFPKDIPATPAGDALFNK